MKYPRKENCSKRAVYFRRKEQPSVRRALPPVGWHRTVVHPWQMTTVWACEKTVVMVKQPGHLTSMKKDRGAGTRVLSLCFFASAAGEGLRRSTARTILNDCRETKYIDGFSRVCEVLTYLVTELLSRKMREEVSEKSSVA
jgi:hypothetical protein